MSAQFPTRVLDPNITLPPAHDPAQDPLSNVPGKLGALFNSDGPINSGLRTATASKSLLGAADEFENNPVDWEEAPKTNEYELFGKDKGVAAKPKDPRLKDKSAGKDGGAADKACKDTTSGHESKPYDKEKYYDKNKGHLDLGGTTDRLNELAYETAKRKKQEDASKGANGGRTDDKSPWSLPPSDTKPKSGLRDCIAEPDVKRTGISASAGYGDYTPTLRENPLDTGKEIAYRSSHAGHENVKQLNGGAGYAIENRGAWTNEQRITRDGEDQGVGKGKSHSAGAGLRGNAATVLRAGPGQVQLSGESLAGAETSAGIKAKASLLETNLSAGSEARVGLFAEGAVNYRPVNVEPKIFGAPINLSPEVGGAARVFNGAEVGASTKMGWRLTPDPITGKMEPECGVQAKASAFVGGMAEADGSVGLGGIGNVGGTVGGMYGIGGYGKAKLGLEKGRLKGELKFGAALGLGMSLGVKVDINVAGLMTFGSNLIKANKAAVNKITNVVTNAARTVSKGASTAVDAVKNVAKKAASVVKKTANKVADKVKEPAKKVADTVKHVAEKVADGAKSFFGKLKFW